jgi:hypothetical protein
VLDLTVEGVQDKDGTRRGNFAGPLGVLHQPAIDPLTKLMDAWDQYVRDIVRDQFTVIVVAFNNDRNTAKTNVDTYTQRVSYYEALAAKTKAPADAAKAEEERAKLRKEEDRRASLPDPALVTDVLMAAVKQQAPPAEEKDQVAKFLRR